MNSPEKKIINKLQLGDKEAFHFIFKKYYLPLYYYAKRITGSKENAEEVLQNTFLKFWEKSEILNIDRSLESYLYKAVYNNCVNLLKQLQIKEMHTKNYKQKIIETNDFFLLSEENNQSFMVADELYEKIENSINKLPEQCRKIFKLSRYEGLKNKEIAKELEISLNTVIKQISIALAKLRKSLRQYLNHLI